MHTYIHIHKYIYIHAYIGRKPHKTECKTKDTEKTMMKKTFTTYLGRSLPILNVGTKLTCIDNSGRKPPMNLQGKVCECPDRQPHDHMMFCFCFYLCSRRWPQTSSAGSRKKGHNII